MKLLFVIPARFERATHSLEGCCSIQLSYRTIFCFKRECKDITIFLFTNRFGNNFNGKDYCYSYRCE